MGKACHLNIFECHCWSSARQDLSPGVGHTCFLSDMRAKQKRPGQPLICSLPSPHFCSFSCEASSMLPVGMAMGEEDNSSVLLSDRGAIAARMKWEDGLRVMLPLDFLPVLFWPHLGPSCGMSWGLQILEPSFCVIRERGLWRCASKQTLCVKSLKLLNVSVLCLQNQGRPFCIWAHQMG